MLNGIRLFTAAAAHANFIPGIAFHFITSHSHLIMSEPQVEKPPAEIAEHTSSTLRPLRLCFGGLLDWRSALALLCLHLCAL
jgi:hypothetical protein